MGAVPRARTGRKQVCRSARHSPSSHPLSPSTRSTSDGLPLILGVTFQYRYIVSQVYDMYMAYLEDHAKVLFLAATNTINDIATHFTAYQVRHGQ